MKELHLELFYLKHKWILIVILFFSVKITAQKITVTDTHNNPLPEVIIFSDDHKFNDKTGETGTFILPDTIKLINLNFYLFGYKTLRIKISEILKNKGLVQLQPVSHSLDEVIIMGRNEQYLEDIISETGIISQKEIQVTNSKTAADALMMSGNVFVQKPSLEEEVRF